MYTSDDRVDSSTRGPTIASAPDGLLQRAIRAALDAEQVADRWNVATERLRHAMGKNLEARATLAQASRDLADARAELRNAVTSVAYAQKQAGASPERTLVLIKQAVMAAIPRNVDPRLEGRLEEDIIRWAIDAFYAA